MEVLKNTSIFIQKCVQNFIEVKNVFQVEMRKAPKKAPKQWIFRKFFLFIREKRKRGKEEKSKRRVTAIMSVFK